MTTSREFFEELTLFYDHTINASTDHATIPLRSEQQVVNYILNELKWRELPDDQKQAKRKAMVSLAQKWADYDNTKLGFSYEHAIIDYYDCAEILLFKLPKDTHDSHLGRLYAMICTEQYCINEYSRSAQLKHIDYTVYTSLLKSLAENDGYKWLPIKLLVEKFETMYSYYPNKP